MNTEMQYLSPDTSRSLPSFCFGFTSVFQTEIKLRWDAQQFSVEIISLR